MTSNNCSRPQFWGTVYICDVNGAGKVKSDAQVAMNKNSDPVQKFFWGWLGDSTPNSDFPNFWNCPKRVELFGRIDINCDF